MRSEKISPNDNPFSAIHDKMHHIVLIVLLACLPRCTSAWIPSNHCLLHHRNKHDPECQTSSSRKASNIFVVADSSFPSSRDTESSVKRWIIQGLTCNGCVERVKSMVQVRHHFLLLLLLLSDDHPIHHFFSHPLQ